MCFVSSSHDVGEKMAKIAVLIPCYNESQTIEKVVSDWKKALSEAVVYVKGDNVWTLH